MAKKAAVVKTDGKVKASAAIRQYMKENAGASAKEVAEAVSKLVGREISANYVYVIRGKKAEKSAAKRRGRPPKSASTTVSIDALAEAARLLRACGGDGVKALATLTQVIEVLNAVGRA